MSESEEDVEDLYSATKLPDIEKIKLSGVWGSMYESERKKASARPIDGPFPDLAIEARRLLGWDPDSDLPYLSTRAAHAKTGVNFTTIGLYARGFPGKRDTLTKLARGLGGDADRLLWAAGHIPMAQIDQKSHAAGTAKTDTDTDPLTAFGKITNIDKAKDILIPVNAYATADPEASVESDDDMERLSDRLPGNVVAITVEGRCMEPYYHDGDIVLIQRSDTARSGQKVVAVLADGTKTCKMFRQHGLVRRLEDADGNRVETQDFRIVGVVKSFMRFED